jgi:galactose mutarotase-like enzyme
VRPLLAVPGRGEAPGGLTAGPLHASFDAARGLTITSLTIDGRQVLGPLGIPFLHPWANRLTTPLDEQDVPRDDNGLPIHGVHPRAWTVEAQAGSTLFASLDFTAEPAFPYAHRVSQLVRLTPSTLRIDTTLRPRGPATVPVAFGFHPYFRLDRDEIVALPERTRLLADSRLIPTGATKRQPPELASLGRRTFDDGYEVDQQARFAIGRRLSVAFLTGYTHAQVYAPPGSDFVCFEPMTAPTNALVSGEGLRRVAPGEVFRAAFEIRVA